MRWSLRYQLLVPVLALLLGVVGLSVWAVSHAARSAHRQQVENQFRQVARTLNDARFPLTQNVLDQLKDLTHADYLLRMQDGRRLSTMPSGGFEAEQTAAPARSWRDLQFGETVLVDGQPYLSAEVRLRAAAEDGGTTLGISYPEAQWRGALWQALRPAVAIGLAGSLGAVGLALFVAQWVTSRVQSLETRTRAIAAGDFRPMPATGWDDELGDLARSVNEMAQQLSRYQEVTRKTERLRLLGQVSAGLGHQLRNGITGARLAVQVHARECGGVTDREALDVALRQLALVGEKLHRFLQLGRGDDVAFRPLALDALVEETLALFRPQCRHLNIDLAWQPPAGAITVHGDRDQLSHLLVNILGNAREAAGPGGYVGVTLALEPGDATHASEPEAATTYAVVEVSDSGPGPPPDVARHLFDEFVTTKPEGVGLGLAVVRRVAELHGGQVAWRRAADRTCFRILLPVGLPAHDGDRAGGVSAGVES